MDCEHSICGEYYGFELCGLNEKMPKETNQEANERHLNKCKGVDCEAVQVLQEEDRESSEEV